MKKTSCNTLFSLHMKSILAFLALAMVTITQAADTVNSLAELEPYLDDDNADVILAPGTYTVTAEDLSNGLYSNTAPIDTGTRVFFLFSGSNSTYDFTGVTLEVETAAFQTSGMGEFREIHIVGNNNILKNLTMVDVGSVYDRPNHRGQNIVVDGQSNRIEGFHMTIKGSHPYGYGDVFGKGGPQTIKHYKHSALLVRGESNHIKDCTLIHRSYGHAIFMQAASNPTIEGCYIEGETRTTDEMLAETSGPAFDIDFLTIWGFRLPPGFTKSTGEGGIRAYNAGATVIDGVFYDRGASNPTLLNNTIVNMRTGVTLTHASGTRYVEGCSTIGCERGYAIGRGDIVNCSSDVQHGPAFGVDYESDSGINADITILPHGDDSRGHFNGGRHVAYIAGSNHNLTFRTTATDFEQGLEINVGGDVRIMSSLEVEENRAATDITINNYTGYPLILDDAAVNITYESDGPVTDDSEDLKEVISCSDISAFLPLQAEANCESSGIVTPDTGVFDLPEHVTGIENGDWIKYESVHFGRGAASVEALASSVGAGGNIEIRLGAVDGNLISTLAISPTDSWETFAATSGDLSETVEGTHDVYLVFTGDAGELFYLDKVEFARVEASAVNFALSGTATQSSLDHEGVPERAIDGNTSGVWGDGSVTHTASEEFPWWEVDLGETKDIGEVVLYPRTNCCPQRWTYFTVSVLDENQNEVFSKSYTEQISDPQGIVTNRAIGRYVRVQLDETNPLSIAELEVYPYQYFDTDGDGLLDDDDTDIDGDGFDNDVDLFPYDATASGDSDGDGIADSAEIKPTPINISTRGYVLDGDKVLIAGFVVEGTDSMTVLVQGVGPELDPDSLLGDPVVVDPQITIYDADANVLFENDDWESDDASAISDAAVIAGSYTLDTGSKSAAIVTTLEPGAYTVVLKAEDGVGGVALIEAYTVSTN
ncbi:carbohydrate-binding protein [Puniceicoccaceae bacterium K14]|nr:carbohydrate-binding protein [Puniceicoccaceae bacterium K14]